MQGEGWASKNNTYLNDLLKDYRIQFHSDSVVRTSYYKYLHPKECFIDTLKDHADFLKTIIYMIWLNLKLIIMMILKQF